MSGLPQGWVIATIDDISKKGHQRKPLDDEELVYVDIGSIDRKLKAISAPQKLMGKHAPSRARKIINTGDVLVSLTRPNLNAVAYVSGDYDNQFASTGFEVIKTIGIESRYIFFLVRTKDFIDSISGVTQGALYPAAKSSDVKAYSFPLPPLNEQIRIVNKLDSLLAKVDAALNRLDKIPSLLKRFRQTVLAAATSGELTKEWREALDKKPSNSFMADSIDCYDGLSLELIPDSWCYLPFHKAADIKSNLVDPKLTPESIHLAPNHVESNTGKILELVTVQQDEVISGKHKFFAGQIIYSKIRPYLNKVCLVDFDGLCSADMYPVDAKIDTKFLLYYMLSERFLSWTSQQQGRVVLPKINQNALNRIPVPTPSLVEQKEIVRRVESLLALADVVEKQYGATKKRIDRLTQSLLAKTFRGELLPQDPNDEPANLLLERIKQRHTGETITLTKSRNRKKKDGEQSVLISLDQESNQADTEILKILQRSNRGLTAQQIMDMMPGKNFEQVDALFTELKRLLDFRRIVKVGAGEFCVFKAGYN